MNSKTLLCVTLVCTVPLMTSALEQGIAESLPVELVPDPTPFAQETAALVLAAAMTPGNTKAIWLVDDFEDSDVLDGWSSLGGTSCAAYGTSYTASQGVGSMTIVGDCGNTYVTGYVYDLGGFPATGVGISIRPGSDNESDALFAIGDDSMLSGGQPVLELMASSSGYWVLRGPDLYWAIAQYNGSQWYDIDLYIDWNARTIDVFIDGVLEMDDAPFLSGTATTFSKLYLTNVFAFPYAGTQTWFDEIVLSTPPPTPPLFFDGFELGNLQQWSATVGCS